MLVPGKSPSTEQKSGITNLLSVKRIQPSRSCLREHFDKLTAMVDAGNRHTEYLPLQLLLSFSSLRIRRLQMNLVASWFSALIQWISSGIPFTRVEVCRPLLSCLTKALNHVLSVKLVCSHPSSGLIELSLHFQLLSVTTPLLNTPRNPPNPFGPL